MAAGDDLRSCSGPTPVGLRSNSGPFLCFWPWLYGPLSRTYRVCVFWEINNSSEVKIFLFGLAVQPKPSCRFFMRSLGKVRCSGQLTRGPVPESPVGRLGTGVTRRPFYTEISRHGQGRPLAFNIGRNRQGAPGKELSWVFPKLLVSPGPETTWLRPE